jgi:hypothetical protein
MSRTQCGRLRGTFLSLGSMAGEMMFAVIAQVLVFVRRHKVEALIVALFISLSTSAREGAHLKQTSRRH